MSEVTAERLETALYGDPWQSVLSDSLRSLCEALRTPDGGFTVDPWTLRPVTGGYAVSVHPEAGRILASVRVGDLLEFLITHGELLESWVYGESAIDDHGHAFGGWHEPSDGRIYLDVSSIVSTRSEALRLARENDQLAVWDFAAGESIATY